MERIPRGFQFHRAFGSPEIDPEHQPFASHLEDKRAGAADLGQPRNGSGSQPRRVFRQLVFFHHLQSGQRRRHGQIVLTEGIRMDHAVLHAVEYRIHDTRRRYHRAHGHISAGKRLGHADDIRFDSGPVLVGEPFAGAAQPTLHLVDHQQCAGLAAKPRRPPPDSLGYHRAGFPLHRFHHKGGHIFVVKRLFQRCQIVERDLPVSGIRSPNRSRKKSEPLSDSEPMVSP